MRVAGRWCSPATGRYTDVRMRSEGGHRVDNEAGVDKPHTGENKETKVSIED